jgi:hypothetical protein
MSRRHRVGCPYLVSPVLAALTATVVCASAPIALAQSRGAITKPDQAPPQARRGGDAAPARSPNAQPLSDSANENAGDGDEGASTEAAPEPRAGLPVRPTGAVSQARRPAAQSPAAAITGDPDDADPDVGDGAERLAPRQAGDGDLNVADSRVPRDGEVAIEAAPVQIDGSLALAEEATPEAADSDEATQDQDRLGRPITPRRFGPYQPIGIRVGSFILFPVLEAGVSSTSNVFRSATTRKSDMFSDVTPGATLTSNWSRHALEFRVQGNGTFHDRFASEDDRRLEAADISRRTNVAGDVSYSYGQESRGGVNTQTSAAGDRPGVITRRAGVEANHRINRLTLQLRGAISDTVYGTVPSTDPVTGVTTTPTTIANERNFAQREVGARAGWQFSPNLTLFADTVLNARRHDAPGATDGILRNSDGYRVQGGVAIDARGKLQGEASAGYASQTPGDGRLKTVSGFIYNGRVSWQPTGLTEVIAEAKSDVGETTTAGSGGALTRQVSVEARHALRRHIILIAGASYSVASFGGSNTRETSTVEKLGLEYYLSREMALVAGYQHTAFDTNTGSGRYEDNTVRVGMRVRR